MMGWEKSRRLLVRLGLRSWRRRLSGEDGAEADGLAGGDGMSAGAGGV